MEGHQTRRTHWKISEEKMLTRRIYDNVYYQKVLTQPSAFGKPLIPSDKKLWQRLADEHNEELVACGMPASKIRTSKSVRDKWRYKLSPFVRTTWGNDDWDTMTELLPSHFWHAYASDTKYDHWQHTFNSWVAREGSAPSIQIMKNMIEKVKKKVKSGKLKDGDPWTGLVDIACHLISCSKTAARNNDASSAQDSDHADENCDNETHASSPSSMTSHYDAPAEAWMLDPCLAAALSDPTPFSYDSASESLDATNLILEATEEGEIIISSLTAENNGKAMHTVKIEDSDEVSHNDLQQTDGFKSEDSSLMVSKPSDFQLPESDEQTDDGIFDDDVSLPALTADEIESLGTYLGVL